MEIGIHGVEIPLRINPKISLFLRKFSNIDDKIRYKLMWIHFWNMVQQEGINNTRMQWVWCTNWQGIIAYFVNNNNFPFFIDIPATLPMEEYH